MRPNRAQLTLAALAIVIFLVGLGTSYSRASAQTGPGGSKGRPQVSGVVEDVRSGRSPAAPGGSSQGAVGRNVLVNQDTSGFPQNETVIAVNPTNPRNLVAGANDYRLGNGQSGFYASEDGGRTWSDGILPLPAWPDGNVPAGGGDPVTLFDSTGVAYFVGLAFDRAGARNAIVLSRSTNGGFTWSRPSFETGDGIVAANLNPTDTSAFNDKEWAAIDLSTGMAHSHPNRIYVTWTRFESAPLPTASPIYESHSDDGGRTWSPPHEISGASTLCDFSTGGTTVQRCGSDQPSWPVVGPDGTVYVFFKNHDTVAENQYLMVKSTDGGSSFSAPVKVADVFDINYPVSGSGPEQRADCLRRGQGPGRAVLSNTCFRVNSFGGPAVARDGTLYLVWSDNRNGNSLQSDADIFLVRSTDGGVTWTAPIRVNNDPVKNGKDQFFPWVAVAPDGTVNVVFHDRRLDTTSTVRSDGLPISPPGNYLVDTWMARSGDRGETWTNFRVTDVSSNFDFAFRNGLFVGDYNGLAVSDQAAYPFYTDARNGTATVRQSDVFLGIVTAGAR